MGEPRSYRYDVYLSYSPADESWVEQNLLPQIEAAGLRVCVPRSLPLGRPIIDNIATALAESRKAILLLTPAWLTSAWSLYESLLVQSSDPTGILERTIPVLLEPCEIPQRIRMLQRADLTVPERRSSELERVIASLRTTEATFNKRVFISYKRSVNIDVKLARAIAAELTSRGCAVFIDQHLEIGQDWAKQIEEEINACDYMVVLLSEHAVQSEMLIKEVEHAYEQHQKSGRAKLLPVRINYKAALPHPLGSYLDRIQYFSYRSRAKNSLASLIAQLLSVISKEDHPQGGGKTSANNASVAGEMIGTIPGEPEQAASPAPPSPTTASDRPKGTVGSSGGDRQLQVRLDGPKFRQLLIKHYNTSELHDLCFDLGINYENIPGSTISDKARELIEYAERHQRTNDLLAACRKGRATVDWAVAELSVTAEQLDKANEQPPEPVPPPPYADPAFIATLPSPGGALSSFARLYVPRDADRLLRNELLKDHGATVTIHAPRQSSKSSLLIRGVSQAEQQGSKSIFIDLQLVDASFTRDTNSFFRYLATVIVSALDFNLDGVERIWQRSTAPGDKITDLMQRDVLPFVNNKIVLAIDEADKLLGTPIRDDVFAFLRSWLNLRARNRLWEKLTLLMAISTEPYLLINDPNQSPFHVGTRIWLDDFDLDQVSTLNEQYRSPLSDDQLGELFDLLAGHPYLTSRALYTVVAEEMRWDRLLKAADTDRGPFGDHLKRYFWLLRDDQALVDTLRQVLAANSCVDELAFRRLTQAGLLKGDDYRNCTFRCKLYEQYFRKKL